MRPGGARNYEAACIISMKVFHILLIQYHITLYCLALYTGDRVMSVSNSVHEFCILYTTFIHMFARSPSGHGRFTVTRDPNQ